MRPLALSAPLGRRVPRRGSALVLVLVFTTALAMLALSAIYLSSGATILGRSYERERDLRYAAEAGLALGKSRLNSGAVVLPATGSTQIFTNEAITGADGAPIDDIRLNVWIGPTGGGAGSRGRFASVVAEAVDQRGGGSFVRRVELAEESFARFAYFTDAEVSAGGGEILFTRGDVLLGPVWSNDNLSLTDYGTGALATFHKDVGTAGVVRNPGAGIFHKQYRERQPPIPLPDTSTLSDRLRPLAREGRLDFDAGRDDTMPAMRIEFFAMDMNNDGDSTDANEGFFKVYEVSAAGDLEERLRNAEWLGGAFRATNERMTTGAERDRPLRWSNCGDWHMIGTEWQFFPLEVHATEWFYRLMIAGRSSPVVEDSVQKHTIGRNSYVNSHGTWVGPERYPDRDEFDLRYGEAKPEAIMNPALVAAYVRGPAAGRPAPRCFLGGDPHLIATSDPTDDDRRVGGTEQTFYASDRYHGGRWRRFPSAVATVVRDARRARGMDDASYVFALHPSLNDGSLGVIHVNGSVGVSGVVNGGVTLYAGNTLVILDDITYATNRGDPARVCNDMLGLISGGNTLIADNGLNTPQDIDPMHTPYDLAAPADSRFYSLDNQNEPDVNVEAVSMALGTSFRVQGYSLSTYTGGGATALRRPLAARTCAGQTMGRGCINLFGGIIQRVRGQVARGGISGNYGFAKQYDYDLCAATSPPPFFPTIGRFIDNRYYEIDPRRFNATTYFQALAPRTGRSRS